MAGWTPDKERILKLISEDIDTIAEKVFGHAGPYDGDDLFLRIEELVVAEKHACEQLCGCCFGCAARLAALEDGT